MKIWRSGSESYGSCSWSPESEQSIVVDRASEVWSYIKRHHSTTLIAKMREDIAVRIHAMLDKLRQPIN